MTDIAAPGAASKLAVAVTCEDIVPHGIGDVFDLVAAEDVLPKILTGYGFVPAVVTTSNLTGPWGHPGTSRIVHLADGSTLSEQLTVHERPGTFAYRVSNPSFALKHLMTGATGQFWFEPARGGTRIRWTYTFHAKNRFAKLPLLLFVRTQWKGYMEVCMKHIREQFAGPQSDGSGAPPPIATA
jgi:hypothetical protein